jgi:hypothetical protein
MYNFLLPTVTVIVAHPVLQTTKTDNNALALTLFITSNLEKHNLI